jgi:two-component system phosphate regulon sensor histidine kinase PhoR
VRNRIFFKLLASFALLIAAVTLALNFSVRAAWEKSLREEISRQLQQKAVMFAARVNTDRSLNLQDLVLQEAQAAGARATVIDGSGKVLADSQGLGSNPENLQHEPELAAALTGHNTNQVRQDSPTGVPFLYAAAPVSGGAVRLSYPLSDIATRTSKLDGILLYTFGLALLASAIVAGAMATIIDRRLRQIVAFAEQVAAGQLNARIDSESGSEMSLVAAALDQTARILEEKFATLETSQHQLETLLNSMQDAVIAIGPDERVQWANQTMERLVPQGARLNAPVVETVRDPDFLRAVRGASQSNSGFAGRASSIVSGRTFEVTAAPLPGGGAVAVLRDLTETERVEKTRRDFIANVSHELRTPLTSIQGYTETLLDGSTENFHSREFLEIIRKNAARMSRLTEDLLTLARVESGEHRFDAQIVLPRELLREAAQSFRERARAHGVELLVEDSAADAVNADREAIHQVFSNLIDNALKYAEGSATVVVGARPAERGVEFYVRDFGPGISSEHLPRLFERFYRVDKARSRESGGTGLGLAIAKHIVLAHGGAIRAESELNHGSMFLFTLPAAVRVSTPTESQVLA